MCCTLDSHARKDPGGRERRGWVTDAYMVLLQETAECTTAPRNATLADLSVLSLQRTVNASETGARVSDRCLKNRSRRMRWGEGHKTVWSIPSPPAFPSSADPVPLAVNPDLPSLRRFPSRPDGFNELTGSEAVTVPLLQMTVPLPSAHMSVSLC
ncbi:carboxypeptidase O [Platysternon megacephalum]|uniref:Carboxypeptidase O n=1 Tax=Platysternon megacephalum TaxID=55544 RepID=A0A4D9EZ97_9SAUR|nr:carboxypeptidase O [Platysternon megacephalum]